MTGRAVVLPAVAAALVAGVLGLQVAHGGGDFTPSRVADPCAARVVTSTSTGLEGLTERLVLLGLDGAACRLGVTREALILDLARSRTPTDAQVAALRAGLLDAVGRLEREGTLPRTSALADEALRGADLPYLVKAAIRVLPDSAVDAALPADDVLRRTVEKLDLRAVLADVGDPDQLTRRVRDAVTAAVRETLLARLRDLLP